CCGTFCMVMLLQGLTHLFITKSFSQITHFPESPVHHPLTNSDILCLSHSLNDLFIHTHTQTHTHTDTHTHTPLHRNTHKHTRTRALVRPHTLSHSISQKLTLSLIHSLGHLHIKSNNP